MTYGTITISGIRNVLDKRIHFFKAKDQWKVKFHARKIILIKVLFQILVTFKFISNAVLHIQSLMILYQMKSLYKLCIKLYELVLLFIMRQNFFYSMYFFIILSKSMQILNRNLYNGETINKS